MNERGEFRPIYVAMVDGPDFQALSGQARWTVVVLKLTLGAVGIGVVPGLEQSLGERTGWPVGDVPSLLDELAGSGWIERERNVVWVVRGLEFEPNLSPRDSKHRSHVCNLIASLPRLAIVTRFRTRYRPWFETDTPEGPPNAPSEGLLSTTTTTKTNTKTMVGERDLGFLVRCVIAFNGGLRDNPELGPTARETSTSEQQGRVTWEADGIPVELAERVIRLAASKFRPSARSRQPNSLKYFDDAVRRAWELEQQPAAVDPITQAARDLEASGKYAS